MQINSLSNSSFTGLWIKNSSKSAGKQDGVTVTKDSYTYRPFADENKDKAKTTAAKFDGKQIAEYYNDSDYPSAIHNVSVKMGTPLNISAAEYKKAADPMETESPFSAKEIIG